MKKISYVFPKESFSNIFENETLHFLAHVQKIKKSTPNIFLRRNFFFYIRKQKSRKNSYILSTIIQNSGITEICYV